MNKENIEQLCNDGRTMKEAMREDPSTVFNIEFGLPSGVCVRGTMGPMLNGLVSLNVNFDGDPTPEDKTMAMAILNVLMGGAPEFTAFTHSKEERLAADKKIREMLGGGIG